MPTLDGLRRAVLGTTSAPGESIDPKAATIEAHRRYQLADYDGAARLLPDVLNELRNRSDERNASTCVAAYVAAAKLATKLGDTALAWVSADRAQTFSREIDQPALSGIANYQVACALLRAGHLADAEQVAGTAAENMGSANGSPRLSADLLSVRGALLLLLAVMAARRGDAGTARSSLAVAQRLAEQLGRDGNYLWTAFGPTNVAIHELSVTVGLGDVTRAQELGSVIDTDGLPEVLRGRRSQVHLELANAAVSTHDDPLAVLHLLEAERVAGQVVSRNSVARGLIGTLLSRERKSATPGLRALSTRAGVP
jgi:hypothetical protein